MWYDDELRAGDLVIVDKRAWLSGTGTGSRAHNCPMRFYRVNRAFDLCHARMERTIDIADGTLGLVTRAEHALVEVMLYMNGQSVEHAVLYGGDCCVLKRLT